MIDKMDKWIIIIIAIGNFIIAFTNYFHAISSHDVYYMSQGIFNLVIGYGLCMLLKKD